MSVKVTPEVVTIICDCCNNMTGENGAIRRRLGALHLLCNALDMHGHPCSDASMKIDLCDGCLSVISKAINDACTSVRANAEAN